MSKFHYFVLQLRTKLWLKPALTGFGAVAWVEIAWICGRLYEFHSTFEIDPDVLLSLLKILASSMLTVAIFAVSAMVAAFASVTTTATPRATRIVMQDRSSQNALAAFLSAFIYAIVALVALSTIHYGSLGRLMLFGGYLFIIGWVLFGFVRWVDQISKLGRMQDTIDRVEAACLTTFKDPLITGTLGARALTPNILEGETLFDSKIGYLQHLDVAQINEVAAELETVIRVLVRPGAFIDRSRPLVLVAGIAPLDDSQREKILRAFTIGDQRHMEADPRLGLLMLAEIADRALSPAVNDPGTAISVISSQIRLLSHWVDVTSEDCDCKYLNVEVSSLDARDLLDDSFTPISRDGAALFEVGVRLQKALGAIYQLGHRDLAVAAKHHSELALEQAVAKLPTAYHRQRMQEIAAEAFEPREKN